MFQVVKRDGEVTEFNLGKINDAIAKAFDELRGLDGDAIRKQRRQKFLDIGRKLG